ncbi:Rad17 cell cycle checkpoint protein-domain-containing protein [Pisolithus orientalis]|uniref:Rad17 cell cycle checkpoint protein-domain-containing protein n=1 Tax=Pisolithus orientalis TaxID=936130 RepID=UPI002224A39A|nr:Rad17 cell cycle checkpoint protein-domain-containing protein [Pisolithus orientalis]KAI6019829.1 Rad17 cell cycle checkpoint protein-domain-containing protein [Pisolithus orientalis]
MSRKPSSQSRVNTRQSNQKKPQTRLRTVRLDEGGEPPAKKLRPHSLSTPPVFDLTTDATPCSTPPPPIFSPGSRSHGCGIDLKGKGKQTSPPACPEDDRLWVDKYEPTTEADLVVHKRKVEDVRRWLVEAFEGGPSGKLRKYRRILALTGPAGTAKTTTLRVLSHELGFEIMEWRNGMNERGANKYVEDLEEHDYGSVQPSTKAIFDKFQAFLTRAMSCSSIFSAGEPSTSQPPSSSQVSRSTPTPSSYSSNHATYPGCPQKRQVILLEDLPNLLHASTQARFKAVLESLCVTSSPSTPGPPIVIIISDAGLRAEHPDDESWDGGSGGRRWGRPDILDIRSVLGPELLASPYVTRIGFNPIAPTLMTKALQALLAKHFGPQASTGKPPKEVLDVIVETSNGDIRSALMALQFACISPLPGKSKTKNSRNRNDTKSALAVLEAVTRREQSLVLFHLMGKVLYNKRKHDPPSSHMSAKEAAKEREMDDELVDSSPLPRWLSHHERKASRVSIEALVADSPIDSGLFGLYTHQNYTQFCTDIEQCDGVCDGLSWTDWVGGSLSTPYAFPTLALSTLHALPTPVPRLGQKVCKPAWFDVRTRELQAWDAVGDVASWLAHADTSPSPGDAGDNWGMDDTVSIGRWTHANIVMELGGWLRAMDRSGFSLGRHALPRSHKLFSNLPWASASTTAGDTIGEHEDMEIHEGLEEDGGVRALHLSKDEEDDGRWWAEVDDIEDVD